MSKTDIEWYNEGLSYYKGSNGYPFSYEDAFRCFIEASKMGNASGMYSAGYMFMNGQGINVDIQRGYQLFLRAASKGNMSAEFELGKIYYYGNGVPRNIDEAFNHFIKAAESGNANAAAFAGDICLNMYKNYDLAFTCYRIAIKNDNANAYHNLGHICESNHGPTPGDKYAVQYYVKAARLGNVTSMHAAGVIYFRNGLKEEACDYLQRAANKGYGPSKKLLWTIRFCS